MRVKINGKEVEVGTSRQKARKRNKFFENPVFQKIAEQIHRNCPELVVNSHKVNMNDPDNIRKGNHILPNLWYYFYARGINSSTGPARY